MNIGLVKSSFYITYIFLITTGTICFIEALRNPIPQIRHIMNLETCISIVAGYFYSQFVQKINKYEENTQLTDEKLYKTINDTRYTDWAISTPLMLLVLCMVLGYENKITVHFTNIVYILILNFLMLGSGYIGEINMLPKVLANLVGFIFFFAMYALIWKTYMKKSKTFNSKVIFYIFLILWAFYGLFYNMDTLTKIVGYNILDLLSKAFVGIFFWLYLTKCIKF
jgi:bacteriorhodopsin